MGPIPCSLTKVQPREFIVRTREVHQDVARVLPDPVSKQKYKDNFALDSAQLN